MQYGALTMRVGIWGARLQSARGGTITAMEVAAYLRDLRALPGYGGQIAHVRSGPEREAAYADPREPLSVPGNPLSVLSLPGLK